MPKDKHKTWSDGKIRRLIELYKERPNLWDKGNAEYRNKGRRDVSIKEIAARLNRPTANVRQQIRSIRNEFLRKIKSGNRPAWPYFHSVMFLADHISSIQQRRFPLRPQNRQNVNNRQEMQNQRIIPYRIENGGEIEHHLIIPNRIENPVGVQHQILVPYLIQNGGEIQRHVIIPNNPIQNAGEVQRHVIIPNNPIQNAGEVQRHVIIPNNPIENGGEIEHEMIIPNNPIQNPREIQREVVIPDSPIQNSREIQDEVIILNAPIENPEEIQDEVVIPNAPPIENPEEIIQDEVVVIPNAPPIENPEERREREIEECVRFIEEQLNNSSEEEENIFASSHINKTGKENVRRRNSAPVCKDQVHYVKCRTHKRFLVELLDE